MEKSFFHCCIWIFPFPYVVGWKVSPGQEWKEFLEKKSWDEMTLRSLQPKQFQDSINNHHYKDLFPGMLPALEEAGERH